MIGLLRTPRFFLFGALLTLAVAGCSGGSGDPPPTNPLDMETVLEEPLAPGDMVRLAFLREPELGGDFLVDRSDQVTLPLLGPTSVGNVPRGDLKQVLLDSYSQHLSSAQFVDITVLWRINVLGSVNTPGLYYVDPTMTLGDAIALAGGPNNMARLDGIEVQSGDLTIRSDLTVESLVTEAVSSGDQVLVPQITWLKRYGAFILAALISATAIIATR
jgi:polysaccharide export outer membrane protein